MSAYEELQREGQFGMRGLRLLTTLMRREVRKMRVLEPDGGWSDSAFDDLVQEFFLDEGEAVTRMLCVVASAAVWSSSMPVREELAGRPRPWRNRRRHGPLPAGEAPPDPAGVAQAASRQAGRRSGGPGRRPGRHVRWRRRGPGEGGRGACPDGDVGQRHATGARHGHSSLLRLLARIFEAAGGSLEIGQIVYAVRGRFHAEYPNAASPPGVTADAVARGCGQEPRPVPVLAA